MTDWRDCPICGEPDMQFDVDKDTKNGEGYLKCVNLCCASNGGANDIAWRKAQGIGKTVAAFDEAIVNEVITVVEKFRERYLGDTLVAMITAYAALRATKQQ